jgi:hypothetical protein
MNRLILIAGSLLGIVSGAWAADAAPGVDAKPVITAIKAGGVVGRFRMTNNRKVPMTLPSSDLYPEKLEKGSPYRPISEVLEYMDHGKWKQLEMLGTGAYGEITLPPGMHIDFDVDFQQFRQIGLKNGTRVRFLLAGIHSEVFRWQGGKGKSPKR